MDGKISNACAKKVRGKKCGGNREKQKHTRVHSGKKGMKQEISANINSYLLTNLCSQIPEYTDTYIYIFILFFSFLLKRKYALVGEWVWS